MKNTKNSVTELAKNIGKKAVWSPKYATVPSIEGLNFEVEIVNVEIYGGQANFIIKPVAGSGQGRVRDNLKITE